VDRHLGGAGLLRPAPGTWGSLLATAVLFAIHWILVTVLSPPQVALAWPMLLVAGIVLLGGINVAMGPWIYAYFGRNDPGQCVIDEGAGMCLALLALPISPLVGWHSLIPFIAALAAFRLFDILKPPPARQLEKLPAGWGILCDDLAAAVYANLLCQILLRL